MKQKMKKHFQFEAEQTTVFHINQACARGLLFICVKKLRTSVCVCMCAHVCIYWSFLLSKQQVKTQQNDVLRSQGTRNNYTLKASCICMQTCIF